MVAICKCLAGKYKQKMFGSAMNEFAEVDSILYFSCDICKEMDEKRRRKERMIPKIIMMMSKLEKTYE